MKESKNNEVVKYILENYDIKNANDIANALKDMFKDTIQTMMNAVFESSMGYENSDNKIEKNNYINGYSSKNVKSKFGEFLPSQETEIVNLIHRLSPKTTEILNNITTNLLNEKYTHTDETVTGEKEKESYYWGYGNKYNVLYKYHHKKGDEPIKEDNILNEQ